MRRSRAVDWWLLGTLLPAYVVMLCASMSAHLASGTRLLPFVVTGAQGANGYPLVLRAEASNASVRPGDSVLRLGSLDLRGLSRAEVRYQTRPLLREGRPFEVKIERDGARIESIAKPTAYRFWWYTTPVWVSLALTGILILLRAPHWHIARLFYVAALLWCCTGTVTNLAPVHPIVAFLGYVATQSVAAGLTTRGVLCWTESVRPGPWLGTLPWVFGVAVAGTTASAAVLAVPWGRWPLQLDAVILSAWVLVGLASLARAYVHARPLERRQLRWIGFGFFVGMVPRAVFHGVLSFVPVENTLWDQLSLVFAAGIPLGILIAIFGYHWLDIDRLISASAALTLVGISLLGGALVIVPPAARAASSALGIDAETGQLALSLGFAVVLVPAYQALHPWLDRRLFAERHVLAERFESLRLELAACRGVEQLATRAAEGIDALFRPESIATYARAGESFTPLFVRGRAAPPAFEGSSTLAQVMEEKAAPLFARAKEVEPFERAALETLGAEVVVPILREKQLLAFTCLAGKNSGDIYTSSDLAMLRALADRCSEVIGRLDADEVARQAQAMQLALRRYVPGAVAERVMKGDTLEPAQCHVSVLFVDIRDYTRTTQHLAPAEVFATLNEHTERVSRIIQEEGGTIVEFNGDGLLAVFGAPEVLAKKEQRAVEAARRIVDSMPSSIAVGIGVATGEAFVGSIRSTDRLIWSAVGSTTNFASRLQSLTRDLNASIATDETTRERAGYVCADFIRHESVAIRGRQGRFDVFALPLR